MLYYLILCDVILYYVMLCYVMLCHAVLFCGASGNSTPVPGTRGTRFCVLLTNLADFHPTRYGCAPLDNPPAHAPPLRSTNRQACMWMKLRPDREVKWSFDYDFLSCYPSSALTSGLQKQVFFAAVRAYGESRERSSGLRSLAHG